MEPLQEILGTGLSSQIIARPSVRISREFAAGVSGLYPSVKCRLKDLDSALESVQASYTGKDRASELARLGHVHASREMVILVQLFVEPTLSGVAHLTVHNGAPQVRLGMVSGHLENLVEGYVRGWHCQLTEVILDGTREVVVIADEEDAVAIVDARESTSLIQLYDGLTAYYEINEEVNVEMEWAVAAGQVYYLQCQPLSSLGA